LPTFKEKKKIYKRGSLFSFIAGLLIFKKAKCVNILFLEKHVAQCRLMEQRFTGL